MANLDERVLTHNPDTVFIEFAVNDAVTEFNISLNAARSNLEAMVDRVLAQNAQAEIILLTMTTPVVDKLKKRPLVDAYYEMYRSVAKERKLRLIDINKKWKELLANDRKTFDSYVPDGIHPNDTGAKAIIVPTILEAIAHDPAP